MRNFSLSQEIPQASSKPVRGKLLIAMATGAIAMTVYYTRQLAVERDTAQQTATFLADLFSANDPYQRNRDGLTVEALLETGIAKLERDSRLTPLVRARLLTTIAQVQLNLGNIERADALATEALDLTRARAGETVLVGREDLDAQGQLIGWLSFNTC